MKLLILLTLTLTIAVACFRPLHAGEFSFSTGQRSLDAGNDQYTVRHWDFFSISYQPDDSSFYYGLSYEQAEVSPIYFTHTLDMTGLFAGVKTNITKNVRVFGSIGYYLIEDDFGGRKRQFIEGLTYYLNDRFGDATNQHHFFDEFEVETEDRAFGGTFGVELIQPVSKDLDIGFSLSRRLIKINETLSGYKDEWDARGTGASWKQQSTRDYSSTSFGVNLNYAF